MDFGKQIDEHETSKIANNQQIETQEVINTNEEIMTRVTKNQTIDENDATPLSPDFSNITTDVGDNPYIRRPTH